MFNSEKEFPLVAIIGKTNVGKSSLFNRLVEQRKAIISDEPGVTRDILYTQIKEKGIIYRLADSAGIVDRGTIIHEKTKELNKKLIDEATLLLFVSDIEGPSSEDFDIAELIRRKQKPCILVINKVDNEKQEENLYSFYELSIGDPVGVSAIHSRNISRLREEIIDRLSLEITPEKEISDDEEKKSVNVAIVGKPNVGKSSLLNLLTESERALIDTSPGTTRDPVDQSITFENYKITLIDTAGIRKRKKVKENVEYYSILRAEKAIKRSHLGILVIDGSNGITRQDKMIASAINEAKKGIVVAVNKWDIAEKKGISPRDFITDLIDDFPPLSFTEIVTVSAKTGYNKIKLLKKIINVYNNYNKVIKTGELNRVLRDFSHRGIHVQYGYQKSKCPPVFEFFINRYHGFDKSFEKFIENSIRKSFCLYGVPVEVYLRVKK